ncbi:MAG TPA: serine O-acetyltransferase [Bacillota bacterium]|jgi:serine O-acetyltransferase|nr:serine O-acetyltransferase [Bacillota bacterium]HNY68862.1 serine O-acetyltransferase [Bacillota bacterium]HPU76273.1 serine O-acetyltransferase [Bacillota bacterium]
MFSDIRSYVDAAVARDPAARSRAEVLLLYPGVHALAWHKLSHWLYRHSVFGLARFLSQLVRFFTGIEIHPGAHVGQGVFIDHGMGVVIGETAIVGSDVTIYQGVTLGGTGKETGKRHPTIEDGVVVSAGAIVLGSITVGANSKIGAGAVVIHDVPADCTVVGVPGRVVARSGVRVREADVLNHGDLPDPVGRALEHMASRLNAVEAELHAVRAASRQRPKLITDEGSIAQEAEVSEYRI